jgi:alpha-1,6-mannosyltransferase
MKILVICGLLLELLLLAAAWLLRTVPARPDVAIWIIPVLLLASVPAALALWKAPHLDWSRARWWIIGIAVAARLTFLPVPLVLSDDAHRYLWEGHVQCAGFNPFRYAPHASELEHLRDENWKHVAHGHVSSAYPPLLLLLFRGVSALASEATVFKTVFMLFDLATLWVIVGWLRERRRNPAWVLAWAWNPLVILEFAGMGHEMTMAIFFFVLGVRWLERDRSPAYREGWATGAAMMSHVMAWPVCLAAIGPRRVWRWRYWLGVLMIAVPACWLFADAGTDAVRGLANFAGAWRFNGSVFELLVWLHPGESRPFFGDVWMVFLVPKLIAAGILAGIITWSWTRGYSPARSALATMAGVLLLSSTVHPWYVTWLAALTCVEFRPAWWLFSVTVLVSYVAKLVEWQTGLWTDSVWVRWIEYAPVFLLLGWHLARKAACRIPSL